MPYRAARLTRRYCLIATARYCQSYIEARMEASGEYGPELEADAKELQGMLGLSAAAAQVRSDLIFD